MPETMEVMETIDALIEHDLGWLDREAAFDKVVSRLKALGWDESRARTAVEYAVKEWNY